MPDGYEYTPFYQTLLQTLFDESGDRYSVDDSMKEFVVVADLFPKDAGVVITDTTKKELGELLEKALEDYANKFDGDRDIYVDLSSMVEFETRFSDNITIDQVKYV